MRLLSNTRPSEQFAGETNSDLAFIGPYVIQGSYNGFQVWDISDPAHPALKVGFFCPASQSDVSVYKNLLFVSGEAKTGRLDCGGGGVQRYGEPGAHPRHPHLRHHATSHIPSTSPTCRRAAARTRTRCSSIRRTPTTSTSMSRDRRRRAQRRSSRAARRSRRSKDPNSALFRIEVIKVPLAHPEQAAIVSSPRIFNDLAEPPTHGRPPRSRRSLRRSTRAAGSRSRRSAW